MSLRLARRARTLSTALPSLALSLLLTGVPAAPAEAAEEIRLPGNPSLGPKGRRLAFTWRGDIWLADLTPLKARKSEAAPIRARLMTRHPANERDPAIDPKGERLAFISNRSGVDQVWLMAIDGSSAPVQLTFHSEGVRKVDWMPDGQSLLISAARDHFWRHYSRFFLIKPEPRSPETLLFDATGRTGSPTRDGRSLLFIREGVQWWRKGYTGPRSSQIWRFDRDSRRYTELLREPGGARFPIAKPDGSGFLFVSARSGSFNLFERTLAEDGTARDRALTSFGDDSVVDPSLSADGSTVVFRHLFDFYRLDLRAATPRPVRIRLEAPGDTVRRDRIRRMLSQASALAATDDGLEMAFIAGGDLWVMDTQLREPIQVTRTAAEEREPLFSKDGKTLWFISDHQGQTDIWRVRRSDKSTWWWRQESFEIEALTNDATVESRLSLSPLGDRLAFVSGRGDLVSVNLEGEARRMHARSWNAPRYDWSPDGRHLVFARDDNDFNRDIWIVGTEPGAEPLNISRHPDNEGAPVWSPDGKVIAFVGRRRDREVDIFYVFLRTADDDRDARERRLEKALKTMAKARKSKPKSKPKPGAKSADKPKLGEGGESKDDKTAEPKSAEPKAAEPKTAKGPKPVRIDRDRIHERVRRIALPHTSASGLVWIGPSTLAFQANLGGQSGTWTVEIPGRLKPRRLTASQGRSPVRLDIAKGKGGRLAWLNRGAPGTVDLRGKESSFPFKVRQSLSRSRLFAAAFDQCWQIMRDNYYDEGLNDRDWQAVREKYRDMASRCRSGAALDTVVSLMLGELNGSHLGFTPTLRDGWRPSDPWREVTAHLGLRFVAGAEGPGLLVRDVLPDGPCDEAGSRVKAGERVIEIDDTPVRPGMDMTELLNGPLDRDITLEVQNAQGNARALTIRPISYRAARSRLYEAWVDQNQKVVEKLGKGRIGYLHISGMNWPSFQRFERELYAVGSGRDALIIDVRENGGGFTADHLLTALCQPEHAITVPRGGGPGYPQDRRVYATWSKPVVVLCNQNSFSNAEIFSHAIKSLGRGPLVGVQTAGGVISTGASRVMDVGVLRIPFRGWFVRGDGEDMELKGALPDHVIWPAPGEWMQGRDRQLVKGIELGLEELAKSQPRRPLKRARDRRR